MRRVIILGSTGSIGTQALEVIAQNPSEFEVVGLAAGTNRQLLDQQAEKFAVSRAVQGARAAAEMVRELDADVVVNGITGSVGLEATLATLETNKVLALANKESLIVGGKLVTNLAKPGQIVPVDSEHSALAQCLLGGSKDEVAKLILTASGGPFRGFSREQLAEVTPQQALAHPTWVMGKVVTTNSATLVNKGLELIEAHLLFDIPFDRIEVTVHPQSVVHSMVEFTDGSVLAQCSPPNMKLPIALGMSWPRRLPNIAPACDWSKAATWTFEPLDESVFRAVALARRVGEAGLTYPAVYNAANEQAVEAFHQGKISFLQIVEIIERVVDVHTAEAELSLDSVLRAEKWARDHADALMARAC
ncbi:1-deoxy-D-xylulose-5-phosphate reductoisomerase [Candidatus Rhodoluna planktonica]|uniref:1-deoxy-D-xylulose 5-phosphate reductoisomerase n=1 Tax=Candidatus Rhodoluna planktonica TaxID=535712 RepID=A0A1D9DZR5_9MICO|nr:1-deoxy-D-xylulose-5-phosphate reductoisomerase [Candidatus Rhodoluna planktonica]AOY56260.1 1-deoxy-D-xylulose-5-phosphate reductoisomerase [Candidatus Rhodoluna planktonica]